MLVKSLVKLGEIYHEFYSNPIPDSAGAWNSASIDYGVSTAELRRAFHSVSSSRFASYDNQTTVHHPSCVLGAV